MKTEQDKQTPSDDKDKRSGGAKDQDSFRPGKPSFDDLTYVVQSGADLFPGLSRFFLKAGHLLGLDRLVFAGG